MGVQEGEKSCHKHTHTHSAFLSSSFAHYSSFFYSPPSRMKERVESHPR